MGLSLGGLMSIAQSAASVVANLVGQDIVARSISLTQTAGNIAVQFVTGGRLKLGTGTTDYLTSNGTTQVIAAGNFNAVGTIDTSTSFSFGGGQFTIDGNSGYTGVSSSRIVDVIQAQALPETISSGNGGSAGQNCVKVGTSVAPNATANVFGVYTSLTGSQTNTGTSLFAVQGSGAFIVPNTDSTGTPGNATINQLTGRSSIALGAATVTITNSLVTTASHVFIAPTIRDTTGLLPTVTTISNGSFVVTTVGNCAANLTFNWWVLS